MAAVAELTELAALWPGDVVVARISTTPGDERYDLRPMVLLPRKRMVDTMNIATNTPSVLEAGLPVIEYRDGQNPDEAHQLIRQLRRRAPIAIGPHGPEVLTYWREPCCATPGFVCRRA